MIGQINEKEIREALLQKRRINGIKRYINIMKKRDNIEFYFEDFKEEYQKFYGMKRAIRGYHIPDSEKFYDVYFQYLKENLGNTSLSFEKVLKDLYDSHISDRVEASFSSKLLATVNPNMPVWDQNVFYQLKIPKPKTDSNHKDYQINETIKTYQVLMDKILEYLNSDLGREYIRVFNQVFDEVFQDDCDIFIWKENITDVKKIDFVLWSLGKNKER